ARTCGWGRTGCEDRLTRWDGPAVDASRKAFCFYKTLLLSAVFLRHPSTICVFIIQQRTSAPRPCGLEVCKSSLNPIGGSYPNERTQETLFSGRLSTGDRCSGAAESARTGKWRKSGWWPAHAVGGRPVKEPYREAEPDHRPASQDQAHPGRYAQ